MPGPRIVDGQKFDPGARAYDAVVVGGGIVGAIVSKVLSDAGRTVLVLEAGTDKAFDFYGYLDDLSTFYGAFAKDPESPWPDNPNAPQPRELAIAKPPYADNGYFVERGPLPFGSTYARTFGGTTLHWMGVAFRMLPEDFELRTRFGHGLDWPIGYRDLMPHYDRAEEEIGVAADVEDQAYLGIEFEDGYVYPMHAIPPSYLDQVLTRGLEGMTVQLGDKRYPVTVTGSPAGRNGTPNPGYRGGKGYRAVGAAGYPFLGERCEGNTNCVPICPIQAKYNALKTWAKVKPGKVTLVPQAVASEVLFEGKRVTGIRYKAYADPSSPRYLTRTAQGTVYVLAAHAVENAKLLLASGAGNSSGLVGRHLMDHPVVLTWGTMPEKVWAYRGPLATSGIESLRGGAFRKDHASFRIEIGNDGWVWATFAPGSTMGDLVENQGLFGGRLRKQLNDVVPRHFRLGFLLEQTPERRNRVTIDPRYRDQLGEFRPVIDYDLSDYTKAGAVQAVKVWRRMVARLGAEDFTSYEPQHGTYFEVDGKGYEFQGAGHFAGTHLMGTSRRNSVVDRRQRSWDHTNLFLSGCGTFPTVATSNPTLTAAALAFWCADNVLDDLR